MLEQVIAENTAVMKELVELLRSGTTVAPPSIDAPKAKAKAEKAKVEAPAAEPQAEPAKAEEPKLSYNDVAKHIVALDQAKGKAIARGLLATFGASTLKDVKPERYAEVIEAAKAAVDA